MEAEVLSTPPTAGDAKVVLDSILSGGARPEVPTLPEDYRVRIPSFEGPLDLLLHLIRKEQVDIYDIPVTKICQAYLEHLQILQQFDIDLAGEFMVMAATLTFLKSQVLIPKEETEEEEEDPRLPLVEQLLEYERFKKAAVELDMMPWLHRDIYPRPLVAMEKFVPKHTPEEAPVEGIETYDLLVCLKTALDRTTRKPHEIHDQAANLRERAMKMGSVLPDEGTMEFRQLLPRELSTSELVVSFLAVLELAKLKFIKIFQSEIFGPIQLQRVRPMEELDTGLMDQF
ncbi:MAG: segregation/condensation protein A [Bdellovibrionaceae bacterium]|nr:segregation/condensation protein A [Pseudobdellovibrionaceae bacterium]